MAESAQEKTEQPTPKRRKEAREKGQVVKSAELNSVVILFGAIITLYFMVSSLSDKMVQFTRQIFLSSSIVFTAQ